MKKLIVKYPLQLLVLLGIILRLPYLRGSFWMDEAAQALEIVRPLSQQLDIIADFQPPLLHFILHFAQYFSHTEWFLRIIGALIPGILTIIFTYKLAEKLFSRSVAILTTILLTTSSFHIFFSQELRPYSLPTALAVMSMYYFLLIAKNQHNFNGLLFKFFARNSDDNYVILTIVNALGLYASYLYPFFMLAQITYALTVLKFKHSKQLFISFIFSILAFVPFLPIFLRQLAAGGAVRDQLPGWDQVVSLPQLKALPMVFGKLIFGVLPFDLNPVLILLFITLTLSGFGVLFAIGKQIKNHNLTLILTWILIPVLTAWLISFIVPVVSPKRLLYLLPGLYILFGYLAQEPLQLLRKKRLAQLSLIEKSTLIFFLFLLITNMISTTSYYLDPKLQRENWRSLQQEMHQRFEPESTLIVYSFPEEFAPMRWYEQFEETPFKTFATKSLYIEDVKNLSNDLKIASNYKTVLVFDYLRDLTDPNKKIEARLAELGFKEVGVLDYPNIGFVRIFMQPLTILGSK
ncbi:glycosyltransferase family 39 protein [Candidatus Woesebacteria bacterium]|nr:glycosyltransferase family 39 protein [Candidatus Woesebacteria bacterium]